jgi:diguanylate cyclase (GGDEF)-like protein
MNNAVDKKFSLYDNSTVWKKVLAYVVFLFVISITLISISWLYSGGNWITYDSWVYFLFFLFSLFTIFMGFPHINFGYASFDRVAQVASILILGPIMAAIVEGMASLVFPLFNIRKGRSIRFVVISSLNNAALMSIMVLLSGLTFEKFGGQIPLERLNLKQFLLLLFMLVLMQLINSLGMRLLILIRDVKVKNYFSLFSTTIEMSSGLVAILLAIVFNRLEIEIVTLFVFLLMVTFYILRQFAYMSSKLDRLVVERTKSLIEKTKELEFKANHDSMTGLINRNYMNRQIVSLLNDKKVNNDNIFIAFADVDDFKTINDKYSHDIGDKVLIQISRILKKYCDGVTIISRFGGEEFVLCFYKTSAKEVLRVCRNIVKEVTNFDWEIIHQGIETSLSIGVVQAHSQSLHKSLISRADAKLYQAKSNGKNQVVFCENQ